MVLSLPCLVLFTRQNYRFHPSSFLKSSISSLNYRRANFVSPLLVLGLILSLIWTGGPHQHIWLALALPSRFLHELHLISSLCLQVFSHELHGQIKARAPPISLKCQSCRCCYLPCGAQKVQRISLLSLCWILSCAVTKIKNMEHSRVALFPLHTKS